MLDRTKMPPNLRAHRVWVSNGSSGRGARSVVYVTERRRRAVGAGLLGLGLVVALPSLALHAPIMLIVSGLGIGGVGSVYAAGGRAGFYEVNEDGSLGEFLGRSSPGLSSMRGMKVP